LKSPDFRQNPVFDVRNASYSPFISTQDGSVRQFFEQRDVESGQWTVWFDGLYIKKSSASTD